MKIWKIYLISGVFMLFAGVTILIKKNYVGAIFTFSGLTYISLGISYYKKNNK